MAISGVRITPTPFEPSSRPGPDNTASGSGMTLVRPATARPANLPAVCPECGNSDGALERYLYESGTPEAHVLWECGHCGSSNVRMVSATFHFTDTDLRSYNVT